MREHNWFRRNLGWIFGIGTCFVVVAGFVFLVVLGFAFGPGLWDTYVIQRPVAEAAVPEQHEWEAYQQDLKDLAGANPEPATEPVEAVESDWLIEVSSQQFTLAAPKSTWQQGSWEVLEYDLDDDPIVKGWLQKLKDPAPGIWRTFPNIPNPDVPEFDVAAGAEYGVANVPYCQQDMRCDLVVPPWHYRLVTGNYKFLGRTCGAEGVGCLLLVINVMDKTYTWRDVTIDNGFTVPGRYWDGDKLEWATWGLVSHASANMLNMPTMASEDKVLNAGDPGNAGGNCGDVNGCQTIDATVVVHAGDRVLAIAHTTVTR